MANLTYASKYIKKKKKKEFKLVFKIYSFILVAFIHSGKHGEIWVIQFFNEREDWPEMA